MRLPPEEIYQHARARQRAGNFVKYDTGRRFIVLDDFCRHADIAFPTGTGYVLHFTQFLGFFEPVAHVDVRDVPHVGKGRRVSLSTVISVSHHPQSFSI